MPQCAQDQGLPELRNKLVARAALPLEALQIREIATDKIANYLVHALRQIDQIGRRLVKNETIPHHEKVFSVHEPHTRWINKGKAGVPAELGLPDCFLEDQYQLTCITKCCMKGWIRT